MALLDATLELPLWLVVGVALGLVFTVAIGLAFYLGQRRYGHTSPRSDSDTGGSGSGRSGGAGSGGGSRSGSDGSGSTGSVGSGSAGSGRSNSTTNGRSARTAAATDGGAATGRARRRIDGTERRRREIRHYLEAIGETFREDHEVAGATVAFYLPERDVAVTFDARAYFRIEEAGHSAVLCEHELPGANLGARLPFDAPTFGHADEDHGRGADRAGPRSLGDGAEAREQARRVRAAFATLGLPPYADAEAVQAAYRRRIKEVHPDHGGDREQFGRVREAYELASASAD